MARFIHISRKKRLIKKGRQTRWTPFWIVPKINGAGKKIHPGRYTKVKRNWRRSRTKA